MKISQKKMISYSTNTHFSNKNLFFDPNRYLKRQFFSFFLSFRNLSFKRDSNIDSPYSAYIGCTWKKKYLLCREHAFKKNNNFAIFGTKSRFRIFFFHVSRTCFSIITLTNIKNFCLHIFLLNPEKSLSPVA